MTDMSRTGLDTIPYDVFYQVASTLDCHDYLHLSRVNRALNNLMRNESIARKTVERTLRYTKEGKEASKSKTGYRDAIGRLFDIREAFATAQPYSASILGYGSAFLYSDGSLCYIYNDEIRCLDVHGSSRVEQVLNIYTVLSRAIPTCSPADDSISISLMHYSSGILTFLAEIVESHEAWILAVDMRNKTHCAKNGRMRFRAPLSSTRRLFVRNNENYLYYGTHSSLGYHGYPQWAVACVDLRTGKHVTDKPVDLVNFAGNETGQTVCFDVHQDHLYAVSTQVDFEEEEVDWTSYYVWICLAPDGKSNNDSVTPNRLWRRQHREGPINDSWSDLSLRHDEATNRLMILECRREWHHGGSENFRTYYIQPLPSPAEVFTSTQSRSTPEQPPNGPSAPTVSVSPDHDALPDDPLTKTLDSTNKPNYEPPKKRLRRNYHQEHEVDCPQSTARHDFILAKTKFRTYNSSASSFVDLVNDPRPAGAAGSLHPRDRLRLRTVSRKRKSPIDEDGSEGESGLLYRPETDGSRTIEHSEERFASRGVHLWPPEDAPPELDALLCPSRRAGKVHAMADDRSLVYSVDQDGLAAGDQAIVLINFDPCIRLPGLQTLPMTTPPKQFTPAAAVRVSLERPQIGEIGPDRPCAHMTVSASWKGAANQAVPSVREEPAMYLSLRRGYWLR